MGAASGLKATTWTTWSILKCAWVWFIGSFVFRNLANEYYLTIMGKIHRTKYLEVQYEYKTRGIGSSAAVFCWHDFGIYQPAAIKGHWVGIYTTQFPLVL